MKRIKSIKSIALCMILGIIVIIPMAYSQSPAVWWTFDETKGNKTLESVGNTEYEIDGNFRLINGVRGKCLKSDGFTTNIRHYLPGEGLNDARAITFEAWIALETYPWNRCAIISGKWNDNLDWGYEFSVGPEGELILSLAVEHSSYQSLSGGRKPPSLFS